MKSKIAMFLFAATLVAAVSCGKKAESTDSTPAADTTAVKADTAAVKVDTAAVKVDTAAAKADTTKKADSAAKK